MSRGDLTYDDLVALIGQDAAERLSEVRGGRGMYVPHRPGPASPLAAAVGQEAADILGRAMGGDELTVPVGPGKRARIRRLKRDGVPVSAIAADIRCTERFVYKVLAEEPADPGPTRQMALPL
ncbi:MAG: hypothetical protein M0006_03405 [Magnetospirillum sp.]|nr:hypothetical protein [Magnetospirillum sp.]